MRELDGQSITVDQLAVLALAPYGHFTSMRVDDRKVRGLGLHLERLERDCRSLFDVPLDLERVRAYIRRVLPEDGRPVVVRVTVFDPDLTLGSPGAPAHPRVLVVTRSAPPLAAPPLSLQSVRYTREDPSVKHVSLYGPIRLKRIAQRAGFDDVVFHDDDGYLVEGSTWNIGFFDGTNVLWPEAAVLEGTTSRLLAEAYPQTVARPVHRAELPYLVAAFATNAVGVTGVSAIDDLPFDPAHPIVATLQETYAKVPPEEVCC